MSIESEGQGLMSTSRSDDFVPQRPSRPPDNETFYWHPVLGYIRADHARHLYADSARGEEVRNGADCGDGEDRDQRAMGLEDCCGDDCSDERDDKALDIALSVAHPDDEDEEPSETEEPIYTRADMARVAEAVEGMVERFGNFLDEHRELRALVKDQQVQIETLVAALKATKRDEDLTSEDVPSEDLPSEDVETEAEDLPPMLN
jgi:hypothetical protein